MKNADSSFRGLSAGATLIASGTIIPLDTSPIDIGIPIGDSEDLVLRVAFQKDQADAKGRWEMKTFPENPLLLQITMINLEAPLGGGPSQPISLWKSPQHTILAALRFYTQGDSPATIHFSFYRREEAAK